ncbi:tRNA/rRNA methyltransferase [Inquilinus ginsengisoli]|uniref:tRNA (cytidine/uridine-2'-O-)-methyltransferase TrmJ n=1 Tax=Inquilinus ginsengisoli TaxID=363840 RepID=A0ABU1JZ27_9PROT|nr:RNA methyltransferase [Inquilinus ginsengisoli]MDR6293868.1 tRNA/rRNA methyltransferase [Inquilinus ginsengisoli]
MAGTDQTQTPRTGGPAIILIEPQMGENIGTAARAMLNCGLTDLRLVRPRDGWPNPRAVPTASGADAVLDQVRVFERTEDAIAGLTAVYATTARLRDQLKPVVTPRRAAEEMRAHHAVGTNCGILFGPERAGMTNDDVALADAVVNVPLNPAFSSLNLAQAVLLVSYEWFTAGDATPERQLSYEDDTPPATKDQLVNMFEHLEQALDARGFFRVPEKRPSMQRNIRAFLQRAQLSTQEVRTLHGIIVALSGLRKESGGE